MRRIVTVAAFAVAMASGAAAVASGGVAPAGALIIAGDAEQYRSPMAVDLGGTLLLPSLTLGARAQGFGDVVLDRDGTRLDPPPAVNVLLRAGLSYSTVSALLPLIVGVDVEGDLITGTAAGQPDDQLGVGLPASDGFEHQLRKASLLVSYEGWLTVLGGYMTSHWGMGLLANDGAHPWQPGTADLTDPRGGDRVLRAMFVLGPVTNVGLQIALGYDVVQGDDVLLEGDEAQQALAAVSVGRGKDHSVGIYGVYRTQRTADGKATKVVVVDVAGESTLALPSDISLKLEAEVALITGETELGPTATYPVHDVLQLGAAARASFDAGGQGFVLDFIYASGDRNFDDGAQNAFKVDANYSMGFLLFEHVMAAQTGRAAVTAADLTLVGRPSEDLDRLPTRGAVSNTVAFFPRYWVRPTDGLEIYGGPMMAFSEVDYADPFNSRLAGGDPRNALGGNPGAYLGTEVDLGLRWRGLFHGTELTVGIEGAALIPGPALADALGATHSPVWGGRFILSYRL